MHGLLSIVAITVFNPTLNNIIASFFSRTFELYGFDAITSQFFVAIAFDSMITIFSLQPNVSVWAAVRQSTNKETPARGQDQVGNTF